MLINKYGFIIVLAFYMIFMTLVSNAVGNSSNFIGSPDGYVTNDPGIGSIWSLLTSFWTMMTFNIQGMPFVLNLLFVVPIYFGIGMMVIDVIKDVIPFT